MGELSQEAFDAAVRHGEIDLATKPRARVAHYDREQDRIVLDLVSGASFSFPARLAQGLEHATPDELAAVEVSPSGFGLHWEALDADFSVEGLLAGRFGTARYMAERFGSGWDAAAAE
jgi:hypothetical protein